MIRGRLDGSALRDVETIFRALPKSRGGCHFGSRLVFAPDGTLFISLGEPVHTWVPSIAQSGMSFYTGERFPSWRGDFFVGSLKFGLLVRLDVDGDRISGEERLLSNRYGRVRDVIEGPDEYILCVDGGIRRSALENRAPRPRCVIVTSARTHTGRKRVITMKGAAQVVEMLNEILFNELTAINQYFLHSRMLRNWGVTKLAQYEYKESIDEMQHADKLVERILFLEGLPNLQDLGKLMIGEDVREILECDLKLEEAALPPLREGIALCERQSDYVSRALLETILETEEDHVDWLEAQFDLIKRMGLENYVQLQSGSAD